jgi:hypothetical protein
MILTVLTECPRIYCLAKSLDLAVIKLIRKVIDLFDLSIGRMILKFKCNSHNFSVTFFSCKVPFFRSDVFYSDCCQTPTAVDKPYVIASNV